MKSLVYIGWIGMVFFPVQLWAQGGLPSLSEMESVLNPSLWGKEILYFEVTEQDAGSLSEEDAPVAYQFCFRNVSEDSVFLTRVTTSCGCTAARMDKTRLGPGGEGTITLVFNPQEQAGVLYKTAFVYTSLSDKQPVAKLALTGEIRPVSNRWADYPYVRGSLLRMRQDTFRFRELSRTEIRTERVVCVNSGNTSLRLSALLLPSYATFRTEPERVAPGEELDLVVTLDGKLLPDDAGSEFTFPLVIEGLPGRPSDRILGVKVSLCREP